MKEFATYGSVSVVYFLYWWTCKICLT